MPLEDIPLKLRCEPEEKQRSRGTEGSTCEVQKA